MLVSDRRNLPCVQGVSVSLCDQSAKTRKEAHSDHFQEKTDGAKNGLDKCDTLDFLCEVQGSDGRVQYRDSTIPSLGCWNWVSSR